MQGDIAVDEGNYKEAVKFFEKAVEAADNNATAPIFLMKAGRAYKALGDTAKAKECFERIATAYPSSFEARDIEKIHQQSLTNDGNQAPQPVATQLPRCRRPKR